MTVPAQQSELTGERETWPVRRRLQAEPETLPVPREPPWRAAHKARRSRAARPQRRPPVALAATVAFALLAAFFAWQAAEPLWLAVGHGEAGTATVTRCRASEHVTYRCIAFQANSGAFQVQDVTLLGAGDLTSAEGERLPARMVSAGHDRAYAVSTAGLHLRWSVALLLVLACGAGIAWATGATRLDDRRSRRWAVLVSFAGPLLLAVGFLTAAL